jgi:uncharacterized protein (TIGR00730 family)
VPKSKKTPLHAPKPHAHLGEIQTWLMEVMTTEHPHGTEERLYHDLLHSIERLKQGGFNTMELRLINTALRELRYSMSIFKDYHRTPKAAVFGSARTPSDHPDYKMAKKFGAALTRRGWMTITGGASGIMEAAMVGAGAKNSFGLNIRLPFEQDANFVIRSNKKLMNFKYFFTRKLMFLKESAATVLLPGGFGTFDEGFESLTLVQTGKAKPRPIVLIDHPGSDYWETILGALKKTLERDRLITPGDLSLMRHFQDAEEAADEVVRFYRNYDSSRFFEDKYLIRVKKRVTDGELKLINRDFKDLLARGRFARMSDPRLDDDKDPKLDRILFHFNRSGYHRLRALIDVLNSF